MEASHKKFQVMVKNVHTLGGKNAADFIEWYEKIRISLNIYDKAAFRVLQGAPVPSAAIDTDGSKLAAWNTTNEDLYNMLFFTTKGAACSVVRRFAGKTLDEGSGHGQRAWVALREKFDGCSREALRAEHDKMNPARMSPAKTPTNSCMSPILAANASIRATLQRDRRTVISWTSSSKLFRGSTSASAHPTSRSPTSGSPTSAALNRYLCGQPCQFELDDRDCGVRGRHAHDRRQLQRHHWPLLRTRGSFQEHVSPPCQARAAATTTRATERTAEPAAGRTASTRPAAWR